MYKFDEDRILSEVAVYIDKTYNGHYAGIDKEVQAFELMAKHPERALNFATMNALKYADRYGYKNGSNRDDLMKIVHYGILALYAHDKLIRKKGENE